MSQYPIGRSVPPSRARRRAGRRAAGLSAALLLTSAVGVVGPWAPAASATSAASLSATSPYCGIYWGSLAKTHAATTSANLTGIRSGRHDCYDRLVLDVQGQVTGYDVRYVSAVHSEGSGEVIPLRGGAAIAIVVHATAYDVNTGDPTYVPAVPTELTNVSGFRTFRQVSWGGSFEGQSTVALGVRARLPFRVFVLAGPGSGSRLVIDVAHRW